MTSLIYLADQTVFDAISVAGFGLYVMSYTMRTPQRIKPDSIRYLAVNLVAAAMVLVGLMTAINLASALIQTVFICSSGVAILIRLHARQLARTQLHY